MTNQEMITADDPNSDLCTLVPGADHDWRIHEYRPYPKAEMRRSFRCVWCHVVACGNVGEHDPCMRPYHHEPRPHLSRTGNTWPIGGARP